MSNYYLVTIEETLSRTVKVEAENIEHAYFKAERAYRECEIVLDADDFVDKEITVREVTDEDLSLYEEVESEDN